MVSAFWLLVTKSWLNVVKASVSTNILSIPPHHGSTLKKSIQNRSRGLLATSDPVVSVDLCNDSLQHGTDGNGWHTQLHLGSLYPNKISLLLEPMFSPIHYDLSHHATYKAWLDGILWGAPAGVILHHWWCISNVIHPVSSPVNQTAADIYVLPHT